MSTTKQFLKDLTQICSISQMRMINAENIEAFQKTLEIFNTMPVTYQGDEKAYLHYFNGNQDWYITEKDCEPEQLQAFGYANIGYGFEAGYISLIDFTANNIQLDLFFTPKDVKTLIEGQMINDMY